MCVRVHTFPFGEARDFVYRSGYPSVHLPSQLAIWSLQTQELVHNCLTHLLYILVHSVGLRQIDKQITRLTETLSELSEPRSNSQVLCRRGRAVALSVDHKPNLDSERQGLGFKISRFRNKGVGTAKFLYKRMYQLSSASARLSIVLCRYRHQEFPDRYPCTALCRFSFQLPHSQRPSNPKPQTSTLLSNHYRTLHGTLNLNQYRTR